MIIFHTLGQRKLLMKWKNGYPTIQAYAEILLKRLSATATDKVFNMGVVSLFDTMLYNLGYFDILRMFFEYFAKILGIDLLKSLCYFLLVRYMLEYILNCFSVRFLLIWG